MNSRTKLLLLVGIQLIIIGAVSAYLVYAQERYTYVVTPMSRSDIATTTPNDRLKYFYDLAEEGTTAIPSWLPYRPVYIRNNDQLNDRFDYVVEKPQDTYRIITLGDSWTFGMHVSTKDSYSEVLEDMLNTELRRGSLQCGGIKQFEVLNFGVGGYDIEYMVERLRIRGMKYDPDLVIPLIKPDDFILVSEIWQPKIVAHRTVSGDDSDARIIDGVAVNPRQDTAAEINREIRQEYRPEDLDARGDAALQTLSTFYRKTILFFVYAMLSENESRILSTFASSRMNTHIYEGISMLEPEEKVPHDEHPGVIGHVRFAQSLFETLKEQRIIPCTSTSRQ